VNRILRVVERLQNVQAGSPVNGARPELLDGVSNGGDSAHAGNYDAGSVSTCQIDPSASLRDRIAAFEALHSLRGQK
jgi:hypothetical protein